MCTGMGEEKLCIDVVMRATLRNQISIHLREEHYEHTCVHFDAKIPC